MSGIPEFGSIHSNHFDSASVTVWHLFVFSSIDDSKFFSQESSYQCCYDPTLTVHYSRMNRHGVHIYRHVVHIYRHGVHIYRHGVHISGKT